MAQDPLKIYFFKNSQTIFKDFIKAINEDDIKSAHRIAHTLKSNAGFIGEKRLHEIAAVTEGMLKNGENLLTGEQIGILKTELKAVLEKLSPLISEAELAEDKLASENEKREIFEKLEEMLAIGSTECLNLIDKIRAIPGAEELVRQIEGFEFEQAIDTLSVLKKRAGE